MKLNEQEKTFTYYGKRRLKTTSTKGDKGSQRKPSKRTFNEARHDGNKCPKYAELVKQLNLRGLLMVNNRLLDAVHPDGNGNPSLLVKKPTMKQMRQYLDRIAAIPVM